MTSPTQKKRVAIICGGKSSEHEVSLTSASNIIKAINPEKFDVVILGIDKKGCWHSLEQQSFLENQARAGIKQEIKSSAVTANEATEKPILKDADVVLTDIDVITPVISPVTHGTLCDASSLKAIDVIFPITHGTLGEDGALQGFLKLANLPFVGSDVLGSAIGMDKDVMKRLLAAAGILVAKFLVFRRYQYQDIQFDNVVAELGLPFFVKPCNAGSSVGISKVKSKEDFQKAIDEAFKYDHKILLEEAIIGKELECAVLGNEHPQGSVVGELIVHHEFYSYEAKYLDAHGASIEIPAKISEQASDAIRATSCKAFEILECHGLARVDFFLTADEKIYLNEINTLPGFTSISMFPMLWQASGISYEDLIERLIELAIERQERDSKLVG